MMFVLNPGGKNKQVLDKKKKNECTCRLSKFPKKPYSHLIKPHSAINLDLNEVSLPGNLLLGGFYDLMHNYCGNYMITAVREGLYLQKKTPRKCQPSTRNPPNLWKRKNEHESPGERM